MVSQGIAFCLTLTSIIALCSCSTAPLVKGSLVANASQNEMSLERKTFNLVNSYRQQKGLSPLQYHPGLSRLARGHSDFMAKNDQKFKLEGKRINHYGFNSRSQYAQTSFSLGSVAENVAAGWGKGSKGVTGALSGWKKSKGHNRTMLGSQWDVSGVGIRVDERGDLWITQLFAVKQRTLPRGIGPELIL